jgi:hypothetical protein
VHRGEKTEVNGDRYGIMNLTSKDTEVKPHFSIFFWNLYQYIFQYILFYRFFGDIHRWSLNEEKNCTSIYFFVNAEPFCGLYHL